MNKKIMAGLAVLFSAIIMAHGGDMQYKKVSGVFTNSATIYQNLAEVAEFKSIMLSPSTAQKNTTTVSVVSIIDYQPDLTNTMNTIELLAKTNSALFAIGFPMTKGDSITLSGTITTQSIEYVIWFYNLEN